jgi:hypothetical protein
MKIGEKHRLKIELQSIDSMNYSLGGFILLKTKENIG